MAAAGERRNMRSDDVKELPAFLVGFLLAMLGFATVMNYFWFYKVSLGIAKALGLERGEDEEGGVMDVAERRRRGAPIAWLPNVPGAPSCAQGTLPYQYSTRYLLWCEALGQCGGLPSHADDASQLQRCPPNHHHPCPSPRNP